MEGLKMAAELDRSKQFGQVYGVAGASFEQDGKLFNGKGLEVAQEIYDEANQAPADPIAQLKSALAELGITEVTSANKKDVLALLAQVVSEPEGQVTDSEVSA
jgi:hypothetical protein